jgi:DNA-binding NarL/FixJ family response regulator
MTVVGHATNGHEAIARFRELKPDVVLMDLAMPEMDGVAAIRAIHADHPEARILVLTTYDGDENVYKALESGAKGYLLKDCSTTELLLAIRKVHAGETMVSPRAASRLAERAIAGAALSPREVEVLKWIAPARVTKK